VIEAARAGRYMHGNGAMWYVTDMMGNKFMIDTVNGTITTCPEYSASEPHTNNMVANELENWLMIVDAEQSFHSSMPRHRAMDMIRDAARNGGLFHTNGAQWYIDAAGTVVAIDLFGGPISNEVQFTSYSAHAAWKYKKAQGASRTVISEDIKKYLSI
jgi:hypothetical protein